MATSAEERSWARVQYYDNKLATLEVGTPAYAECSRLLDRANDTYNLIITYQRGKKVFFMFLFLFFSSIIGHDKRHGNDGV